MIFYDAADEFTTWFGLFANVNVKHLAKLGSEKKFVMKIFSWQKYFRKIIFFKKSFPDSNDFPFKESFLKN